MLELMTISRVKDARGCMREHQLKYELGYRAAQDDLALRFGALVHLGLEAWWRMKQAGASNDECLTAALAAMRPDAEPLDPFEAVKAEAMMRGYDLRWKDEPYEVLAVEARFEMPLVNPGTDAASRTWRLGGKVDAIVRDLRDGAVRLVEHKTSSEDIRPGSTYWKRLRIDGQVSIYFDGAAALGHPAERCLYDVLGKPALRPLKATPVEERKYTKPTKANPESRLYANQRETDETPAEYQARIVEDIAANPDAYFQRCEVVRLETELDEARFDVWQTAQIVQAARLAGRHPRNPGHCQRYGRMCPFFDVCTGAASLEDDTKFTRLQDPHPELQEAAQ